MVGTKHKRITISVEPAFLEKCRRLGEDPGAIIRALAAGWLADTTPLNTETIKLHKIKKGRKQT